MKHTKIYHITARFLLAATLLAVSWTSATAAETAVPYARIENDELVFYYDGNITDTDWAIVGFQNPESRGWHESASSIAGVRFDDSFKSYAPTVASYWFYGMSQVQTIDLSEIDMSQLTEADGMFQNCTRLTTIYVNESWPAAEATVTPGGSTSSVTGVDMFNGCRSLVGGSNTAYDGQYTGYSYAHIDGGVDYPGYFTAKSTSVDPNFHIYICFGQSNMEGNAQWEAQDEGNVDSRFQMLATCDFTSPQRSMGNWYTAECPIVSPDGRLGPTDYFGRTMVANLPNNKIGVIAVAMGGSPIEAFDKDLYQQKIADNSNEWWALLAQRHYGGNPYGRIIEMAKKAQEVGVIKGILLHQGESNNADPNWPTMVKKIYEDMLTDLGLQAAEVPLFVGEMLYEDMGGGCYAHNTIIEKIPEVIPTGHVVSAKGLPGNNTDVWHFSAAGYRTFGKRYAKEALNVVYNINPEIDDPYLAEPYAALNDNNTTVTFYYDGKKTSRSNVRDYESWRTNRIEHNLAKEVNDVVVTLSDNVVASSQSIVVDLAQQEFTNQQLLNDVSITLTDGTTITFCNYEGSNNPTFYTATNGVRFYAKNYMTIRSSASPIAKVVLTCDSYNGTAYVGNEQLYGSAIGPSLTIKNDYDSNSGGTQLRVKTIEIFYAQDNLAREVKNVVFDESFANYTTLTSTNGLFKGLESLESISGLENLKTDNVTDMADMFHACLSLTSLDLRALKTDNVTDMHTMFLACSSLSSLNLNSFNTAKVTNMNGMFYNCSSLTSLNLSGFKTDNVTRMDWMFYGCSGLTSLDLKNFNTVNVTDMTFMFDGCSSLKSLDVSGFKTDNVTRMHGMFFNCSSLTSLDVSHFNTQNVTDMGGMFSFCTSLTSLDVTGFNTQNVTNVAMMFNGCSSLTTLNLSGFKTYNVTEMGGMFFACSGLTSLDLSGFNTTNVMNMQGMFYGCFGLTSLDLSSFNTAKVTDMENMFYDCSNLTTIYVGNGWSTTNVTESAEMFNGCTSLEGGAGTTYDASHTDAEYARIDGGTSAPGYFTDKNATNPSTDEHNLYPAKNIVWGDITWKNAHNSRDKDNNYMPFLMGSGLGYKTLLAESFYSEEQGANITRPYYTYVDYEAGETGVPGYGLYYKFTPKTSGQLRFNTWVNKGNRKTFVVKESTGAALEPYVDYTFDGYVTGQNNITDGVSYPIYFTADEIKARHDESGTVNKYVVDKGNQIFWGWITLNVEAGESYYIYQQTSQLGFGGYDFIPTGGTTESYVSCIRSTTDDTFALSSEFAAVVDENGKATNVTERGSFVRFGTTNMDVEALGSSTPISVEADLDIQPYAVLSDNNTVLTFYYDDQKSARGGMDIGPFAYLEHGFGESQRPWHDVRESIVYAVIDPSMSQYTSLVSTGWWFYGCKNLKSVSGWENLYPLNIVDMWGTFEYCSSLPSDPAAGGPDFSNFYSNSLKRTVAMFHGCTSMTSLDLSALNTSNVTENEGMFEGCSALTTIYVGSGWDMSNATDNWIDNMFSGCTSLVGGAGTRYDANNIGTSYAHIDGGVDNPGYLTELIRKPLTAADYFEWTGMKANATKKSESPYPNCYYILGQSAEIPYGEPDVNPYTYADLSAYDRLEVTATGNTPRILLNRDSVGGQWNEDEALSHMIESTQRGWSSKYFSHSGNVWTVDLKQIVADKGFAHLNAIKGDSWSAVTVIKIELVKINSTATAGNSTFDDHLGVLTVEGDLTMQQAVEQAGGRQPLAERITSLIWNSSVVLTESDLDGFTNPNMLIFVGNKDKTTLTRNNVVIEGRARKVVLRDVASGNGDFHCPQEFFADSIIYTHNYKQATEIGVSRGWETIALPFDVQTITHEKNGVIAPFGSSASDKHFWLRTLVDEQGLARATKIEANHAYLISMPNNGKYPAEYNLAGNVTFATAGVVVPETIYRASQLTTDNGRIILMPNFLRNDATPYYYVLNVGEARGGHPEGSVFEVNYREVLPFQAFTYHEGGQNPSRFISLDELMEGTTGIETIEQPQWSGAEQWWSIDGRKLNGKPSQKGVYIRNGKKVVVKATF